jgi:EmrB/QacA subfamily drug resistance transporter
MDSTTALPTSIANSDADRRRWIALIVVLLGQLMMVLDTTIVNVALPAIQTDLGFSQQGLTWVINAYLISFGAFLLFAGRLGDLIGRKNVFLFGLALFTLASALCGLATSQGLLIGARFIQGLGGAIASAVVVAIIATDFPEPKDQMKAMSAFTFIIAGGASLGLILGGIITESISWHWIFFVNLPIGVVVLLLGRRLIEADSGLGISEGIDWLGSVLVTGGMMLFVYAIVKSTDFGWGSMHTLGFGGGGIALLAAFFWLESRISNPIMPLRVFENRSLMSSSLVRGLLITGGFASFFLGSLYFEHIRNFSAIQTGFAFLPQAGAIAILSLGITTSLETRFGPKRLLIAGLVLVVPGLLLLTTIGEHTAYFPTLFLSMALIGTGLGLSFQPLLTISMADVAEEDAGLASGIVQVSIQIAAAIGLAALGTIATDHTRALVAAGHSVNSAVVDGYQQAFMVATVVAVIGIAIALFALPSPPAQEMEDVGELPEPEAIGGEIEAEAA